MLNSKNTPECWVISDGAAGNERQALALANAMNMTPRVWRLSLRPPWSWFAPHLHYGATHAFASDFRVALAPPWPRMVIGCGRKAALATSLVRDLSNGETFCVQILDPRISSTHFDYVVSPQHDHLRGANVITTLGALNPVDDAWLAKAAQEFSGLAELPEPRIALLIGASNAAQQLDEKYYRSLVRELAQLRQRIGGSFLVSTSRRTPAVMVSYLRQAFAALPGQFWANPNDGKNPYAGYLAHAAGIVVTPDSVNMLSEACATGKAVLTFASQPLRGKFAHFHNELRSAGYLHDLDANAPLPAPPGQALRETVAVAATLLAELRNRD